MHKLHIFFIVAAGFIFWGNNPIHAAQNGPSQKTISTAVKKLSHHDPAVRKNAAIHLGEMFRDYAEDANAIKRKKDISRILIKALNDTHREVRRSVVKSLGVMRDKDSLPDLRTALRKEKDPRVQIVLLNVLGNFKDAESEEKIGIFTEHNSLPLRLAALKALGKIHTKSADRIIIAFLADHVEGIKIVSAAICAENKLTAAIHPLKKNCFHAVPEVRISAVTALGKLADKSLVKFLKKRAKNEEDQTVRDAIDKAITTVKVKKED